MLSGSESTLSLSADPLSPPRRLNVVKLGKLLRRENKEKIGKRFSRESGVNYRLDT